MKLDNKELAQVADMLISYHMHSFRIRREKIFNLEFNPPMVDELANVGKRLRNDFSDDEKLIQAFGFHEVLSRCKYKISDLAQQARESDDPREQYEEAKELMDTMSAADYLLELLNA